MSAVRDYPRDQSIDYGSAIRLRGSPITFASRQAYVKESIYFFGLHDCHIVKKKYAVRIIQSVSKQLHANSGIVYVAIN